MKKITNKLFSNEYKEQIKQFHKTNRFGSEVHVEKKKHSPFSKLELKKPTSKWMQYIDNAERILDYGCGAGGWVHRLRFLYPKKEVIGYDPGTEEFKDLPKGKFDLLISTDVLEHIEPELLPNVLKHMNELSIKYLYLNVCMSPAKKKLSDGRNAHLIIENEMWWDRNIQRYIKSEVIHKDRHIKNWGNNDEFISKNVHFVLKKN
jgi:hypothetical protein